MRPQTKESIDRMSFPNHLEKSGLVATSLHARALEKHPLHCRVRVQLRQRQKTSSIPSGCQVQGDSHLDQRGDNWRGSRQDSGQNPMAWIGK